MRINLSPDAFLARFRDIVRFERGGGVDSVGRFSTPAVVADLDGYVLPAEDALDLQGCDLDDCDVNLSAAQIQRFRAVDGRGPGGRARLTVVARQALADYVADYQRRGNEALAVYRDREPAFHARARRAPGCCANRPSCSASRRRSPPISIAIRRPRSRPAARSSSTGR